MIKLLKYVLVMLFLTASSFSCKKEHTEDEACHISKEERAKINKEMLMLYQKIDSLETQLEKCDNWVNFLEEK